MKPIRPEEVQKEVPEFVIETFNHFINKNWDGTRSIVYLEDIISTLIKKNSSDSIPKNWLDIEPIYIDAGWKVRFDKPGYNETYKAHYEFTTD